MVKDTLRPRRFLYTIIIHPSSQFPFERYEDRNQKGITALENPQAKSALLVCQCCAAAGGIIIGIVLLTGLGSKLASFVLYASGGQLYLALPFIMVASLSYLVDADLPNGRLDYVPMCSHRLAAPS